MSRAAYRLLVEVPLTIDVSSTAYRIEWSVLSHERRLMLRCPGGIGGYLLAAFSVGWEGSLYNSTARETSPEQIRQLAAQPITVPMTGVCDVVFRALVRLGRAEKISGPPPTPGRPEAVRDRRAR